MSSAQLEEMQEIRRNQMLAEALGIMPEELDGEEWDIDENMMSDGLVAGHDHRIIGLGIRIYQCLL